MIQALRTLMLTLPAAPGFVSSRLCQDVDDANTICYVEEWYSSDDLNRQIRSSHYEQLLELMEKAAMPPDFRLNWVTAIKGLEYLKDVKLCRQKPI